MLNRCYLLFLLAGFLRAALKLSGGCRGGLLNLAPCASGLCAASLWSWCSRGCLHLILETLKSDFRALFCCLRTLSRSVMDLCGTVYLSPNLVEACCGRLESRKAGGGLLLFSGELCSCLQTFVEACCGSLEPSLSLWAQQMLSTFPAAVCAS